MDSRRIGLALMSLAAVLLLSDPPAEVGAQAERRIRLGGSPSSRVALVIGHIDMERKPWLSLHKTVEMAEVLEDLGFAVTVQLDATRAQMEAAVEAFHAQLRGGGVGVFYFSGRGVQLEGQNYLIPAESGISSESDVRHRAVPASWVVGKIQESGNELNMVILDACWPWNEESIYSSYSSRRVEWRPPVAGLAPMQASDRLLIAYPTAPGEVVSESLYVRHLLAQMQVPGQTAEEMFRAVRTAVSEDSDGQQTPWESSSLAGTNFYFAGGPPSDEELRRERLAVLYQDAQKMGTTAAYAAVVAAAPDSPYAQLGWAAIARLRSPEPSPPWELRNGLGMEFVLIEPGTFEMGSPATELERDGDETLHHVTISQPLYLGKYEVTQGQWQAVMGEIPSASFYFCRRKSSCPENPANGISWNDAQEFIRELNRREGVTVYRLPTEAEWEYAARAGTQTVYHFGDDEAQVREAYASCDENYSYSSLKPSVGERLPNAWGLHDMHGSVWEWVQDWYGDYPRGAVIDPRGPNTGVKRVVRGGSRSSAPRSCRAANRRSDTQGNRYMNLGFRLARTP